MIYKAIDVANYVLGYYSKSFKENYPVCSYTSNLKLQKILYFLQANHLCTLRRKLFSDELKAVNFGILVQEVWDEYKVYGGGCIWLFSGNIEKYNNKIINRDKELINEMLDVFQPYSSNDLLEIMQRQTPWKNAYFKYLDNVVKDTDLINFFRNEKG